MKRCFKCQQEKPPEQFYRHPQMADGRLNKCKECARADVSSNYGAKRPQYSAYEQHRQADPQRRTRKQAYLRAHNKRNPQKAKARRALGYAVSTGKVARLPCEVCGNPKSQGHHDDYSKPLDVRWLCFRCHREVAHGQTVVCAAPF